MASAPEPTAPLSQPVTTPPTPLITLRQPSTSSPSTPATTTPPITPPTLSWLQGPWTVTHSTLPLWRKARNVLITYTPIPHSGSAGGLGHAPGTHLHDSVTYQSLDASKRTVKEVKGVDKPVPVRDAPATLGVVEHADTAPPPATREGEELAALAYQWRGKGWLAVASSRWEILGWGDEEGDIAVEGNAAGSANKPRNRWVVTYFAKTLFTPAGVDFYSRSGTLEKRTVEGLQRALGELGGDVARLAGEVFEVAFDGQRNGGR